MHNARSRYVALLFCVVLISPAQANEEPYAYGGAQSQGAGTPNQLLIGGFMPLLKGRDSVWFVDVQLGLQLDDFTGHSSIVNTNVAGGTLATSTRLGHRWSSDTGLWKLGVYAGYDTRALKSGVEDQAGVTLTDRRTINFQQLAFGVDAQRQRLSASAYALIPIGDKEQTLNAQYEAGALGTYGLNFGWRFTTKLTGAIGSYYQHNDLEAVNGWGVAVSTQYAVTDALSLGASYSNDNAFNGRVSVQLTYRFGSASSMSRSNLGERIETFQNRMIRVHDGAFHPGFRGGVATAP